MNTDNAITKDQKTLPLIAMRGIIPFPNANLHFDIQREKSLNALNAAMDDDSDEIFLVAQQNLMTDNPKTDELYKIGTVAKIRQKFNISQDITRVLVEGSYRAVATEYIDGENFDTATVVIYGNDEIIDKEDKLKSEALIRLIKDNFEIYSTLVPSLLDDIVKNVMTINDADELVDYICSNIGFYLEDKQKILEEDNIIKRLESMLQILEDENKILNIEKDIADKTRDVLDQNQKEYYLREQMRIISNELGDDGDPSPEIEEYFNKLNNLVIDDETKIKLEEDVSKLAKMPALSQEAAVLRQYLDTVLSLPFGIFTHDTIDLNKTQKLLDKDHYGLKDVKDRIIELLAVRKNAPDIKGQIICLVGPPGVGKTSIAKSIASAMNREYTRISLGGVRDESDIRGHRKTYVGAMPGRIMTAIKSVKTQNPLILLDEIDKMGNDFRGDPSSALLEVLDPEQNINFVDHYIEVPFDLSSVLFITTANTLSTIQSPLLDRMEVIELSSYTRDEKYHIAKNHLLPKQLKMHGLKTSQVKISDAVIKILIDNYTREAGVRKLEREIAKLLRKATKIIVKDDVKSVSITVKNIEDFLGPKRFMPDMISVSDEIGVVNGLAWTSVGGEMLRVEAALMPGNGKIVMTGSLGDVMKESITIATSYLRSNAEKYGIEPNFYKENDIHVHAPEGAVPKDGPSAGVTMITALLSALKEYPVRKDIAMTGEVTLRGKVLPIGGLKEKSMAAHRAGVKTIFIPKDNMRDLEEIDEIVREEITFIPVSDVDEVLNAALIKPNKKNKNIKDNSSEDIAVEL